MDSETLYAGHVEAVRRATAGALKTSQEHGGAAYAGIVFHAGSAQLFHADDQEIPFRSVAHFARFVPAPGPDHALVFRPDRPPRLVRHLHQGFWEEAPAAPDLPPFVAVLDVVDVHDLDGSKQALGDVSKCAYVGNNPAFADALGIGVDAIEPRPLMAALDWERAYKTPFEVECVREAGRIAGLGHAAVRAGVAGGRSERELHFDYLRATGQLDQETPYGNIVAWDEAGAILHYRSKRSVAPAPGRTFLIDAGAVHLGYCSDITRTYVRGGTHPTFREVVNRVIALQEELVQSVAPGLDYVALHEQAVHGVAAILVDLGILVGVDADAAFTQGLCQPFFPHGLGHHLGLQVHDVGGRQVDAQGTIAPPDPRYPFLRTTRPLEPGQVVTIEPGLYFIPLLLEPFRSGEHTACFDWDLIDALVPCGGVRIEDDVVVTATGRENLTRPFVPVSPDV